MDNVSAWNQDHLTATERFRRVVRAMGCHQWHQVKELYKGAPFLAWSGPDPAFQERVHVAETCTRAVVGDLNLITVKLAMLQEFETAINVYEGIVNRGLTTAWNFGQQETKEHNTAPTNPDLRDLHNTCRFPADMLPAKHDLQLLLSSWWQGWSDFVRITWRLQPEEPIRAWFPQGADEVFTMIRRNSVLADPTQASAYRVAYDTIWQNTLDAIAQTGMSG